MNVWSEAMTKNYLDDGQLKFIEKADRSYEAFMKADPCSKNYFSLVARIHRALEHDVSHVRQYDVKAKDFTPETKELARKLWYVRNVYDDLKIDRLSERLVGPRKISDNVEHISLKTNEIEKERRFVRGCLKIFYGIEPGD